MPSMLVRAFTGAKNPRQLDENVGAHACNLTKEELGAIERAYLEHVPGW